MRDALAGYVHPVAEETIEHRLVANRYELQSVRGRGGMGTVWEAEDQLLERRVAVKEVPLRDRGALGDEGTLRQRVLREARVAARVSHASLVTIYDVVDGGDRVFLVQEYVDAPTLHDVISTQGPLAPQAAARIGCQVLGALEALHRAGIVHRDVKPSNVMVLPNGGVKVADFGIALVEDDRDLTLAGSVLGSPGYLAPEQASGRRAEAAADLWALGATLWFAIEGRGPYGDTPGLAALGEVVHGPIPAAAHAGPLAPVLAAVLRKDPAERASAAELGRLLDAAAAEAPSAPAPPATLVAPAVESAVPVAPSPPPAPPPPPSPPPSAPPPPEHAPAAAASASGWAPAGTDDRPRSSISPWLVGLAAALLVAALVAAGLALAGGQDDERAATSATSAAPTTTAAAAAPTTRAAAPTTRAAAPSTTRAPTAPATGAAAAGAVPAGWQRYEDGKAGYTLAHPPGWQVKKGERNITDFIDPTTGAYLRVDWSDKPKDPVAAWRQASASFGAGRAGYEELRLEATTFKGFPGALWEYRYSGTSGRLHASNLTFVAAEDRAYALNFQTTDARWDGDQDLRRQLENAFSYTRKGDDEKED